MSIKLPDIDIAKYERPEEASEAVKDRAGGSQIFGIIGIGHCGSKIAQEFYTLGYHKCLVLNTASMDLKPIEVPEKQKFLLQVGKEGAAKQVRVGKEAVERWQHEIYDLMGKYLGRVDRILLIFGAGGGTGTGGILRLVDIAGDYLASIGVERKQVGIVFTWPDEGELKSQLVRDNAYLGLRFISEILGQKATSAFMIDNGRIKSLYPGVPIKDYWKVVNSSIAGLFHAFNVLSAQSSSYANFDPSDYAAILDSNGFGIMGMATVKNYNSREEIAEQMRNNVRNTLWASGFDLSTAKSAGVVAVVGSRLLEKVSQDVLNYGMDAVARLTEGATVYRGIYEYEGSDLRVYTIIGGLAVPELGGLKQQEKGEYDGLYGERRSNVTA